MDKFNTVLRWTFQLNPYNTRNISQDVLVSFSVYVNLMSAFQLTFLRCIGTYIKLYNTKIRVKPFKMFFNMTDRCIHVCYDFLHKNPLANEPLEFSFRIFSKTTNN